MELPALGVAPTPDPPLSHPTPGRAARKLCASGSRWCPWPPCGSPAFCGSMCPGSGSTSSTPSPSQGPSPTTRSSAPTEVRQPFLCQGWGRVGLVGPAPQRAFLRRDPAQQIPLHRRPGGDPAAERVGAPLQQVRRPQHPLLSRLRRRGGPGRDASLIPHCPHPTTEQHGSSLWRGGGLPLAAVSAWGIQPDPPRHRGQKPGQREHAVPSQPLVGLPAAGWASRCLSQPRASLGAINTCCLGPSSSSC